ncbi:MAG: hypothetical protein QG653_598 [Patescibacteria group bacterium]|nr:hypothetical protein [Patescibacteria group bacterium]
MKKIIIIIVCVVSLSVTTPPKASAIFCANCSTIITQIVEYALQGKEYVSSVAQQLSTYQTMYKMVTTDPMTALFGVNAGKQIEAETRRWLMSGFQGSPLIVQNPEAYIQNSYTNAVRREIIKLESQRTPQTEGIISKLILQRRKEVTKAPAEVKSNVPSIIQKDLCENGGIERIVETETGGPVQLSGEGNSASRVSELYNELCSLDPNTKEGAQRLLAVEGSGAYFSWDSFLARTGGDNDYANSMYSILEVNRRAEEAKKGAQEESKTGFLPDKKCIETSPVYDDEGNVMPGQEDCVSSQIITTPEEVKALALKLKENPLEQANLASIKEQVLGQEALAGLGDLFKGIQDIVDIAQEVGQAVGEVGQAVGQVMDATGQLVGVIEGTAGALGAGGNPNTARINLLGTTNTSYGTVATSTYVNQSGIATSTQISDGSTPEERETVTRPLKETISKHQTAMSKVPEKLSGVDSITNQYRGFISGVNACVQSVQTNQYYQPATDQYMLTNFTNRVTIKQNSLLNPVLDIIAVIRQKQPITNTYLTNILTILNTAKNVASLLSVANEYQTKLGNGSILPLQIDQELEIVILQKVDPLREDMNPTNETTTAESIKVLIEECQEYLNTVRAREGMYTGG